MTSRSRQAACYSENPWYYNNFRYPNWPLYGNASFRYGDSFRQHLRRNKWFLSGRKAWCVLSQKWSQSPWYDAVIVCVYFCVVLIVLFCVVIFMCWYVFIGVFVFSILLWVAFCAVTYALLFNIKIRYVLSRKVVQLCYLMNKYTW